MYLEAGINQAKELIIGLFSFDGESFPGKGFQDYKTNLQEMRRQRAKKSIPGNQESGPDHNKEFVVEVLCGRRVIGRGKGKSKKEAEQRAAKEALEKIHG